MRNVPYNADVLGVAIWYDDGFVVKIPSWQLPEQWDATRASGVQVVAVYDRAVRDGRNYAAWLASHDLYGFSPTVGFVATNRPSELPEDASVKTGSLMDKTEFMALYNAAMHEEF